MLHFNFFRPRSALLPAFGLRTEHPRMPMPSDPRDPSPPGTPPGGPAGAPPPLLERDISALKHRLAQEATTAIGMLESALDALFKLDIEGARLVIGRDDEVDREEVRIEEECFRLLALHQPFARDFRTVAALLKVNADVERVADHASSIAKLTIRLFDLGVPQWPTSLVELGQRVPMHCHALLNALLSENPETAREIVARDKTIDSLDRRLFEETLELINDDPRSKAVGLLLYRVGRELERVGDLMASIAEDVVYLATGSIIRHERKFRKAAAG